MAKMFSQLIDTQFPPAIKMLEIFNRNTVKFSYSCTQNTSKIIKIHNKKVTQMNDSMCTCRIKTECLLNVDCRKEDVIYQCTALATFQPKKVYLSLAEGEF